MKNLLKIIKKAQGLIFSSPLSIPKILFKKSICKIRSIYYSQKIDGGGGKIVFTNPFINFKLHKHKTSKLYIKGNLKIVTFIGGNSPITISLGPNSKFIINGDFVLGPGVKFSLSKESILTIGGKDMESASGIAADSLIMVYNKIEIGKDFLCAWNVFITDSDWHQIDGQNHQGDVKIGDHVWVANNNNILKGTIIGNNCIVASNSKITNKIFPDNVLIGGIPPKILKFNIKWARDIS